MKAVRNIRLCTKDCLCLYVCPTGASNTETGQIDWEKCIGCGLCAASCPSHALSMVPETYPKQQEKNEKVTETLFALALSKEVQERKALDVKNNSASKEEARLAAAVVASERAMAEDLLREAGFMMPQSDNAREFLEKISEKEHEADFPEAALLRLKEIFGAR